MLLKPLQRPSPLEGGHLLGGLPLELGQRAVLLKALVVQQLPHGDVGQLLGELEGLVDVEEDGEEMVARPRAHPDDLGQQQGGALIQLGDVRPPHHQLS